MTTTQGGTSSSACAACRYHRKRCSSDCRLAPYFPANQPKVFQNVHRLFGVSNITKILEKLDTSEQKEDAMKSIRYESDMRERFPVYGCLTIIYQLHQELEAALEELQYVHAQLAICREQFLCPVSQHPSPSNEMSHKSRDYVTKPLFGLNNYCDLMRNDSSVMIQGQLVPSAAFGIQQDREVCEEYDYMFINTLADDRQSYVEAKEGSKSSSESSLRDAIEPSDQLSKSELRTAVDASASPVRIN